MSDLNNDDVIIVSFVCHITTSKYFHSAEMARQTEKSREKMKVCILGTTNTDKILNKKHTIHIFLRIYIVFIY